MEKLEKILSFFNSQAEIVNSLWNFYALVALGVVGFVFTHKELFAERRNKTYIAIIFVFFAFSNAFALFESQQILTAAGKEVTEIVKHKDTKILSEEFRYVLLNKKEALNPWVLIVYHLLLDISILLIIFVFPNKNNEKKQI